MKIKPIILNEAIELVDTLNNSKKLKELLSNTQRLGKLSVLYRGFRNIKPGINFITNDKSDFFGKTDATDVVVDVISDKFTTPTKHPVFTSFDKSMATEFGTPHFFVPVSPTTMLQNPNVDDLTEYLVDGAIMDIVHGYGTKLSASRSSEVMVFTKHYYLINIPWLKTKSNNTRIKTYSDLNRALHYLL